MQLTRMKVWAPATMLALGSVPFVAMGQCGAAAGELSDLKAQLETLQGQVDDLASRPAAPALPEGASLLTINRGAIPENSFAHLTSPRDRLPVERGFTIAVTPTAGLRGRRRATFSAAC